MKINRLDRLPVKQVSHNPEIGKKIMLSIGDIPHITNFSQATFAPGQTAANHCHHDMYEVFFVESGRGIICIDKQNFDLTPGTCIAVEIGEYHEITNTGNTDLVLTYFGVRQ